VNNEKYIGLDVHQATISVAVMDSMDGFHDQLAHGRGRGFESRRFRHDSDHFNRN